MVALHVVKHGCGCGPREGASTGWPRAGEETMSRTVITETTVYTFDELTPDAQATACEEHNRFAWDCGDAVERCQEEASYVCHVAGWQEPTDLSFALGVQGGEPSFRAARRMVVGDVLWDVTADRRPHGWSVWVQPVDVTWDDVTHEQVAKAEDVALEQLRAMRRQMSDLFQQVDVFVSSVEYAQDMAEANGYEYTVAGVLA